MKQTCKRVAIYARGASKNANGYFNPLESQIEILKAIVQSKEQWDCVGVYADDGMPGTNADRPEFQRLLADCRSGKIDVILAHSVSRIARDTALLLSTLHELHELGIELVCEKNA